MWTQQRSTMSTIVSRDPFAYQRKKHRCNRGWIEPNKLRHRLQCLEALKKFFRLHGSGNTSINTIIGTNHPQQPSPPTTTPSKAVFGPFAPKGSSPRPRRKTCASCYRITTDLRHHPDFSREGSAPKGPDTSLEASSTDLFI